MAARWGLIVNARLLAASFAGVAGWWVPEALLQVAGCGLTDFRKQHHCPPNQKPGTTNSQPAARNPSQAGPNSSEAGNLQVRYEPACPPAAGLMIFNC